MAGFSVVILHHNKVAYSRACLRSLLRSSGRPLQVINVDNGSNDGTAALLDEWEAEAAERDITTHRLTFPTNIGAVAGRNAALEVATGDFITFLDNDTLVAQANWLEHLGAFLHFNVGCGIVVPKLLFPWAPDVIECCGCAVSPSGRIQYLSRGLPSDLIREPVEVQCAISAAWMMPKSLVEVAGTLDEAFSPVQYEDLDYCYRVRSLGFAVWTAPQVELYHFEHTTTAGSDDINFKYVTTKNGILFKKRWEHAFGAENGTTEDAAAWHILPKASIEEVDCEALLPEYAPSQEPEPV